MKYSRSISDRLTAYEEMNAATDSGYHMETAVTATPSPSHCTVVVGLPTDVFYKD